MAKLKIKKGDLVQVLSGKDKGLQGKVISVNTETQRVVVEGCLLYTSPSPRD